MVCHSLLQWTTFCQTSPPWPAHLRWPHTAWLSRTELDKAVVLVWLDWLVFCDYGFSVSALWCPLATPTVLLGFLLSWTWGISSRLLQQSAAAAAYLGRGVCPHHRPFWLWMWNGSSRPSCALTATAPWRWGCSSRPRPYNAVAELQLQLKPRNFEPSTDFWTQNGRKWHLILATVVWERWCFVLPLYLNKDVSELLVLPEFPGKIQF